MLPSVVNLSLVSSRLLKEKQFPSGIEGVEPLELSIPRKLLLWAYKLLNGRYAGISAVVKNCEENAKLKMKRGAATSSAPQTTNTNIAMSSHSAAASCKEAANHGGGSEAEVAVVTSGPRVVVSKISPQFHMFAIWGLRLRVRTPMIVRVIESLLSNG
ncbi:uncharacterized protein LOC120173512 [Hibiscus syriacus]|uniref:uncharacterized protein LOC120173512 n=1 Tax=Hibiscus syriacus TaxID=106335 RepID=UPI001924F3DA|nr:uncharacterized protein LOC120173512 [Hibiscus syriacus]